MWWTAQRPDGVYPSGEQTQKRWVRKFDDPNKSDDDNDKDIRRFVQMQQNWDKLRFVSVKRGDHYEEEP